MAYALKRRIYESIPLGAKAALLRAVPFRVWAGRAYRATMARGKWIDRASAEDIVAYQRHALGKMLDFATREVPAYQPYRGVVERLDPFEALKAFPLLSKDELQASFDRYLPASLAKIPHYECTTGGTSGNQLRFYVDDVSQAVETAFIHRMWARVGYTPSCRKATFRGVEFPSLKPGVYWQPNPIYNEMQFSPFHMSEATLPAYIDELRRYRPHYIHGYPSAVSLLAEHAQRHGVALRDLRLRAVLLGSEGMLPGQRETIESVFGCRVFSWYGHSERLVLAGECEHSTSYHHFPDYGVLEVLDETAHAVGEGDTGEIVGTGITSRSLPLIRYRTGDLARCLSSRCQCGRAVARFDSVSGRWGQDFIVGKSGARVSVAALNLHSDALNHVIAYQYRHSASGELVIVVVPAPGYLDLHSRAIEAAFARKLGSEFSVTVELTDSLTLSPRGKYLKILRN